MDIRPIHTDKDHAAALREIDRLWGSPAGTDAADKLDILSLLVERYEETRWPIKSPAGWSPVDVLQYAIGEMGHSQSELAALLGSRSRASEVLARRRALTVEMIHAISSNWKIPADLLVKPYKLARVA